MKSKIKILSIISALLGIAALAGAVPFLAPGLLSKFTTDGMVSEDSRYFLTIFGVAFLNGGLLMLLLGGLLGKSAALPPGVKEPEPPRGSGMNLFVVSFLILFMELALIRWVPAYVKLISYFSNFILLACFLGMGLGCLAAGKKRNFMSAVPALLSGIIAFCLVLYSLIHLNLMPVGISGGEIIYFGVWTGEYSEIFQNVVVSLVVGILFLAITAAFIGPGQFMGRMFDAYSNPIKAYTVNIGASLAGIICISILSFLRVPAWLWFVGISLLLLWLLSRNGKKLLLFHAAFLLIAVSAMVFVALPSRGGVDMWSPYYRIYYKHPTVVVNEIFHQIIMDRDDDKFSYIYNIPYLLQRDSGGKEFKKALVIGSGTGNDLSYAIKYNVEEIHAVDIDPVIIRIGRDHHPNKPYSDKRVTVVNDDGRSFLRGTDEKYDLIVFAVIDSHTLMSNFTSVRLESFLFTTEAFKDAKAHLAPGGVFVFYHVVVEPWLTSRFYNMLGESFGQEPALVLIPSVKKLEERKDRKRLFEYSSIFMTGDIQKIKSSFREHGAYYVLRDEYDRNYNFNGFQPPEGLDLMPLYDVDVDIYKDIALPSDDWPFVYLKEPAIPRHNLWGLIIVALLAVFLVGVFMGPGGLSGISLHYFFLGGAFMLLETESIVKLALIHGTTWFVNSIVFAVVLVMIFIANIFISRRPVKSSFLFYLLLFAALAANYFIPLDTFLGKSWLVENAVSSLLLFIPIAFAGVIFANSFRRSKRPSLDFGSNLLGIILGGLTEYASLAMGYNALLLFAAAMYFISMVSLPRD